MDLIEIQTLIDITDTKVMRPNQGTLLEYDQRRNFVTLIQCVELRSIISYNSAPTLELMDVTGMGFGSDYTGLHNVWTFSFMPDRVGVYSIDKRGAAGALTDDIDGVPVIKNLTETINIERAIFDCINIATKNTIIKAQPGTN